MKKSIIITFFSLFLSFCPLLARQTHKCKSTTVGTLVFIADSIDFRSDLTRLYGKLSGFPHTSDRIDFISLSSENTSVPLQADDIDGVDFRRWFQWEEDGIIPVEIDFPSVKPSKTMIFHVGGPKGETKWQISVDIK